MRRLLLMIFVLICAAPAAAVTVSAGDSITATCGFCIPTYSTLLEFENVAVIGSTSQEWRDSLYASQMQPFLPADEATFLLGSNDAGGTVATDPAVYAANMQWLVDAALTDGAGAVQLLILPYRLGAFAVTTQRIDDYTASLYAICAANPLVSCGPDLQVLFGTDPVWFQDSIHPNAVAHVVIAEELALELPEPRGGIAAGLAALAVMGRMRR